VQLSDIHFRTKSNPIIERREKLIDAILSIAPRPTSCLLLITGDVAWSAKSDEYDVAALFFSSVISDLKPHFPDGFESMFIPGNHDCYLPDDESTLRGALINGVEPTLQTTRPDAAILKSILSVQDNFFAFQERYSGTELQTDQKICQTQSFVFGDAYIRVNGFNTALLTQRREIPGSLSMPLALIEKTISVDSEARLTISLYHHPDNWLEPNLRRSFRKLIESTSHFAFTGHEHDQDSHLVESSSGEQVTYIEADALQEDGRPTKSGFNCVVVDFDAQARRYYLFRWKGAAYSAVVDNDTRSISLSKKSTANFSNNEKFCKFLYEDDFGFTHLRKPKLLLQDFFVYPALAPSASRPDAPPTRVKGVDVFNFVLNEKFLLLQGADLSGKTALLKTLYKDLSSGTTLIPIYLTEEDFNASSEDAFFARLWSAVRNQYSEELLEPYKQLPSERRALLIDNWHKSRLSADTKRALIRTAKVFFSVIVVTSNDVIDMSDVYSVETNALVVPTLRSVKIKEFSATGRGAVIDKWMRIAQAEDIEEHALSKDIEREQSVLDYLIGKKTLPSLPYLILGVLQARQYQNQEMSDPGSFGFLVQKLVLDALSMSRGKRKLIERKDAVLRRFSFEMFKNGISSLSVEEFRQITNSYSSDMKISVEADEILADLLYGRVLAEVDGNLSFKYQHFYYYFLARHFIDEIEGPRSNQIRGYLDAMADRPLTKSNQSTLIFFLFFKKRDPVIDRIIAQANATFADQMVSDMLSDTAFMEVATPTLAVASVDPSVDTALERKKRLEQQDGVELRAEGNEEQTSLDLQYEDTLDFQIRAQFATARLELLGQVIRNFPDSLDGEKKVEILQAAFGLGLRFLHALLKLLDDWLLRGMKAIDDVDSTSEEQRKKARVFFKQLVGLFVRACCDSRLLDISRAVGVNDLEKAYSEAILRVGSMPSTKLIDLAIRLDHSDGFPFRDVQLLQKSLPPEGEVARAVLSDLVVRHTQVFKLRPDTLRKIAGLIGVRPLSLYDKDGN
jgi:predicted MPP superfamily phosphohydrolase